VLLEPLLAGEGGDRQGAVVARRLRGEGPGRAQHRGAMAGWQRGFCTRLGRRTRGGGGRIVLLVLDAERAREIGIERAERGLADVALLRRFLEARLSRGARPMGGGEIRPPIERVGRRRLEPRL